MLKERIITGAGLTCAIAAVLLLSSHIWFLKAVSAMLSIIAAWELCRAGGILDRFDSLVFVIPFTVFVTRCFGPLVS